MVVIAFARGPLAVWLTLGAVVVRHRSLALCLAASHFPTIERLASTWRTLVDAALRRRRLDRHRTRLDLTLSRIPSVAPCLSCLPANPPPLPPFLLLFPCATFVPPTVLTRALLVLFRPRSNENRIALGLRLCSVLGACACVPIPPLAAVARSWVWIRRNDRPSTTFSPLRDFRPLRSQPTPPKCRDVSTLADCSSALQSPHAVIQLLRPIDLVTSFFFLCRAALAGLTRPYLEACGCCSTKRRNTKTFPPRARVSLTPFPRPA